MFNTTLISPLMTYQRIFKKSNNATRTTICGAPEQLRALTSTSTTGTSYPSGAHELTYFVSP
jgi:hypothetical protein